VCGFPLPPLRYTGLKINNLNLDTFVGRLVRVPFLYRRFFEALISRTCIDYPENTSPPHHLTVSIKVFPKIMMKNNAQPNAGN
jgi:hypothetical protein